jgi:galactose mutarotase-like enzyme
MYFSVGGHPAFRVPLEASARYEDYYLEFDAVENAGRWAVSRDGLIEITEAPLMSGTNTLPLTKELFFQDALVFKQLTSSKVSLKSHTTPHGLDFDFSGFPYLGIWAAKNADFVCIEPWCGIADPVNSNQQLKDKEGINQLEPGLSFSRTWKTSFF